MFVVQDDVQRVASGIYNLLPVLIQDIQLPGDIDFALFDFGDGCSKSNSLGSHKSIFISRL